jgi:7,8-dihydroneopterin aldolase/epimerase/oxygenase
MFTIHLKNLRFFSFHGVYGEEKVLGNEYEVNADVTFNVADTVTELEQTVNYVNIYNLIKQRMNIPTALLETVAQGLVHDIHTLDERIISIKVSVIKLYPPITNFRGSVGVSYKKDF